MAQRHYKTPFKKALLQFITEPDPFLAMLKWVMTEMMRIEAEAKVGVPEARRLRTNLLLLEERLRRDEGGSGPMAEGTGNRDRQAEEACEIPRKRSHLLRWGAIRQVV